MSAQWILYPLNQLRLAETKQDRFPKSFHEPAPHDQVRANARKTYEGEIEGAER